MPRTTATARSNLMPALVYAALSTAIVSSLGMLLVPSIAVGFQVPVSTAQWMLTINLLVGAIATPVMGRLSDGPHKKRLLVFSLVIILIGSVLAAMAPNFTIFLIGRALQGLTYGIVPVTIALARRYLEPIKVQSSISSLSVTVSTGIGIGYPLTGIIAGLVDFRFAFWFAALFVVSAICVVIKVVPQGPDEMAEKAPFDFAGTGLLGLGLGALLLGVSEGPNWGWGSLATIGTIVAAAILLVTWAKTALRMAHPLINLRVLRNGDVLLANLTAIGLGAALYIGLSISSLIAQTPASTGYGIALPVFWAGFVMFPLSVGSFTANRIVRRLATRISLTALLPIGAGVVAASGTMLWFAHTQL
ncbi:MFS transporter [Paeniglutamicibacter gangotriensis]|uniref:MFS transporter n=1 Tax=Paeniglutamicibacter gangotriensis TaxID=254787 RepID=UPI0021CDF7CE|nr:MFS transporter [Paeniglutamicibacter gangotriensis]